MKRLLLSLLASAALLAGCATPQQMAFDRKATSIDTSTKSVVLMIVDVSRADASRWQPEAKLLSLELAGAKSAEERFTYPIAGDDDLVVLDKKNVVLIRMALAPGVYQMQSIWGMASAFPIHGYFNVPLTGTLKVEPKSVSYAGRINAVMRPRKDGEFRAGPPTPIIDQAISGMTGSTWDVAVVDNFSQDISLFEDRFPSVKTVKVVKNMLPPFDRDAVQKAWVAAQGPNYKGD
jgi:hypothetical protein